MLSSGYAILYQKGKHYLHRAIFYLNKGQVSQDLKDGYLLIYLLLVYLCLYFTIIYIFPLFLSIFFKLLQSTRSIDRVLDLDKVFVEELKLVLDLDEVFE